MATKLGVGHKQRGGEATQRNQPRRVGKTRLERACPKAQLIMDNRFRQSEDFILNLIGLRRISSVVRTRSVRTTRLLLSWMGRRPTCKRCIRANRKGRADGLPKSACGNSQNKT